MIGAISTRRRALAAGLAAGLGLLAMGCSGDDESSPPDDATTTTDGSGDATTTTSEPSTTTVPGSALIEVDTPPGSGEGFVGALEDISDQTCEAADGVWQASGTVTNPTDADVTYRIYVSYLDAERDTLALIQADTDAVAAGESTTWETSFASDAADLQCVLRVERTPS